jgi:hypothetical protein
MLNLMGISLAPVGVCFSRYTFLRSSCCWAALITMAMTSSTQCFALMADLSALVTCGTASNASA